MLPRLWLLVGSNQGTDGQTMSVIELSWTAKKGDYSPQFPKKLFWSLKIGQFKLILFFVASCIYALFALKPPVCQNLTFLEGGVGLSQFWRHPTLVVMLSSMSIGHISQHRSTGVGVLFFQAGVLYFIEIEIFWSQIYALFDVRFQAEIMRWCTKFDKY